MTTTQAAPNGHRVSPPPCSVENPAELNSAGLPADQANITDDATSIVIPSDEPERGIPQPVNDNLQSEPIAPLPSPEAPSVFPAGAYHVPPKRFAPRPNAYAYDDSFHRPPETEPLPDRCQFMFSDGRQCTMARSDIHPSLCFYHADREEQLFGDPSYRCETRKLDFPELFSACRDLSTAAGVNRALAQVFRLLAQRRISRQEAATFAKLGHLLLQSIRDANTDYAAALLDSPGQDEGSYRSSVGKDQFMIPVVERQKGVAITPLLPHEKVSAPFASRAGLREISPQSSSEREFPPSRSNQATAPSSSPTPVNSSTPPIAASPEPRHERVAMSNSRKVSTFAASVRNSPEISTYKNAQLEPLQNQHLRTNERGAQPNQSDPI